MRLSKPQRLETLISAALAIVRDTGADGLTLATLADRAGVSRPIAYEHFETRSGLLIALYQRIHDRQAAQLRKALSQAPASLGQLCLTMSHAYFACHPEFGPEFTSISAALQGTEEMAAAQQRMSEDYADIMLEALRPWVTLEPAELRLRCLALLGAAQLISREIQAKRLSEQAAISTFAAMLEGSVHG